MKTNRLKVWLTALTVLLTTATMNVNASCCDTPPVIEQNSVCCDDVGCCPTTWRLYVEPMVSYTSFKCNTHGSKMTGAMGGAAFGFDYTLPCSWVYTGLHGQVTAGKVKHSSFDQHSHLFDAIFEGRIGAQYSWDCGCSRWESYVYTGVGYAYLNDRHHDDGLRSEGDFNTWYIPLALGSNWIYSCWSVGFEGKLMPQIYSRLNSHKLGTKMGYSIELPIKRLGLYGFCANWNVGITPFYTVRQLGREDFINAGAKLSLESRF